MEYTDNLRLQYVTSPATFFKDLWPLLEVNWKIIDTAVSGKQEALTFDSVPTNNSPNPVTSGGVYTALSGKQNTLTAGAGISIDNGVISVSYANADEEAF